MGLCHRWAFIQRTLPNIGEQMLPLGKAIRNQYIPALIGRAASDTERELLSLPASLGGAAIVNPAKTY